MLGTQKFLNRWIFIFLGLGLLAISVSFMISGDLFKAYQTILNEDSRRYLTPASLFHISSDWIPEIFIWIGLAGVITTLGIILYRNIKLAFFSFISVLLFVIEIKIFLSSKNDYLGFLPGKYFWGLDLSLILFLFIPVILLLSKTKKEKIISYILVAVGFIVLAKSSYIEGLIFCTFSLLASLIFIINKRSKCIFLGILGLLVILGLSTSQKIIHLLNARLDSYLDNVLLTLYTKEISFLPKVENLYSTKTVYNLWSDFIPVYILERFGWLIGGFLLLIPIGIFLYGLFWSIKNIHLSYGKVIFVLSTVLLLYTIISLLPLIPYFPKYGLYYPLYGHITGFMIVWIYLLFMMFFIKGNSENFD